MESAAIKEPSAQGGGIIVYRVAGREFAVHLPHVREVIGQPPIKPVPHAHPFLQGVFELRQSILPLCNLRRWLDIPGAYPESAKVIVCEFLTVRFGLWVDDVDRIFHLPAGAIRPPTGLEPYTDLLEATVQLDRRLVLLLDYERLFEAVRPAAGNPGAAS